LVDIGDGHKTDSHRLAVRGPLADTPV